MLTSPRRDHPEEAPECLPRLRTAQFAANTNLKSISEYLESIVGNPRPISYLYCHPISASTRDPRSLGHRTDRRCGSGGDRGGPSARQPALGGAQLRFRRPAAAKPAQTTTTVCLMASKIRSGHDAGDGRQGDLRLVPCGGARIRGHRAAAVL